VGFKQARLLTFEASGFPFAHLVRECRWVFFIRSRHAGRSAACQEPAP
jgi:hypothetical protein